MESLSIMWSVIKTIFGTDDIIDLKKRYGLGGSETDTYVLFEKIKNELYKSDFNSFENIKIARETIKNLVAESANNR